MGVERGRSWFYGQLSKLEDAGRLRHDDATGAWTVVESRELIDA
jgi:hypothetical protein